MKERTSLRTGGRHRRKRLNNVPAPRSLPRPPRKGCAATERTNDNGARKRRTLLVPVDFTESSLQALDHALALAKRLNTTVTLLHVVDSLYGDGFLDESARLKARANAIADARLRLSLIAASRMARRVPMECVVRCGNAGYEIFRFAESGSVHLIVLGRKTRNALSRFVFGSVTKDVIEASPCAVVVVPERDENLAWTQEAVST